MGLPGAGEELVWACIETKSFLTLTMILMSRKQPSFDDDPAKRQNIYLMVGLLVMVAIGVGLVVAGLR